MALIIEKTGRFLLISKLVILSFFPMAGANLSAATIRLRRGRPALMEASLGAFFKERPRL
jgi:hypothetical protein